MRTIAEYKDRYAGRRFVIVGKGPTKFDYANLKHVTDPVIFINDAVQFERHATASPETFFFAHDPCQAIWLTSELQSVAVIPRADSLDSIGVRMLSAEDQKEQASTVKNLCVYKWSQAWRATPAALTDYTREQLAVTNELYLHCGTIHSAIHFAWLCGAVEIAFIGCDGWKHPFENRVYDPRVEMRSGGKPKGVFAKIRAVQDWMCGELGIATEYVNEPRFEALIPKVAHFVWLGKWAKWVGENVATFHKHNPGWDIKLWQGFPADMPADLLRICGDADLICTKKDVLSYWLLYKYGGVFLDADMVTLRSMEPLCRYRAFACRQHDARVNCAAMGSVRGGTAMAQILDRVKVIAADSSGHRTQFGPKMLTDLYGREGLGDDEFAILPRHYFYLLIDAKTAHPWWKAAAAGRERVMREHSRHVVDQSPPYAVHLWGVDGSGLRSAYGHGDALAARLLARFGQESFGAELGVLAGKMSEHLLRGVPGLRLLMVDAWAAGAVSVPSGGGRIGGNADMELAISRTAFADGRRCVIHSDMVSAAADIVDGSLDWVFIDGDHRRAAVEQDLVAWYPKVKPGGLIAGHDWENPLGVKDGVQQWDVQGAVEGFRRERGIATPVTLGADTTWFFDKPGG